MLEKHMQCNTNGTQVLQETNEMQFKTNRNVMDVQWNRNTFMTSTIRQMVITCTYMYAYMYFTTCWQLTILSLLLSSYSENGERSMRIISLRKFKQPCVDIFGVYSGNFNVYRESEYEREAVFYLMFSIKRELVSFLKVWICYCFWMKIQTKHFVVMCPMYL